MTRIYACLHVCDFPVAVRLRKSGLRQPPPALVFHGAAPNAYVYSANEKARKIGVREGMTVNQAEGRFAVSQAAARGGAKLLIEPRDEQGEREMQRELLDAAQSLSPRVEDCGPGLLVVDLTGLPEDPCRTAAALAERARRLALPANVAVSQNRFVAVAAARTRSGITHVPPHELQGFLDRLSVETLPLSEQERKTFSLWGVRTVGEFSRLPLDSLTTRFGERGAWLTKLARGEAQALFKAWEAPRAFEESWEFDWRIQDLDQLSFSLAELLRKLCDQLRRHGSAAESLRVRLKLADDSCYERTVALAHPLVCPETLLKLARLELAAHPTRDAIEGLSVSAKPVPQRTIQYTLFEPSRPSPEKLAVTLTRLKDLVGPQNVGAPAISDSHLPRSVVLKPFAPPNDAPPEPSPPSLAFRCFRPPIEAEVLEERRRPSYVTSRIATGRVHKCAGPWRADGDWWSEDPWGVQEWDIELPDGLFRLSCDSTSQLWRLVGAYD